MQNHHTHLTAWECGATPDWHPVSVGHVREEQGCPCRLQVLYGASGSYWLKSPRSATISWRWVDLRARHISMARVFARSKSACVSVCEQGKKNGCTGAACAFSRARLCSSHPTRQPHPRPLPSPPSACNARAYAGACPCSAVSVVDRAAAVPPVAKPAHALSLLA